MSVELLQILSVAAYILAVVMLVVSIILFFVLNIRKVIGNLSGSTAKKAINDIRQKNEMSGRKSYKPSAFNLARGKITDKMTPSGNIANQGYGDTVSPITEKFSTLDLNPQSEETTILDTTADETTILNDVSASEDTVVLSNFNTKENPTKNTVENGQHTEIRTEVEIGFTDSDEIIE